MSMVGLVGLGPRESRERDSRGTDRAVCVCSVLLQCPPLGTGPLPSRAQDPPGSPGQSRWPYGQIHGEFQVSNP